MPSVQQGSVIRAWVTDPSGKNPKARPLVVVSTNSEIAREKSFVAVAITGHPDGSVLESDEVPLPWHAGGRCKSGLKKPSVAKCSWMCPLTLSDVIEIKGHLRGSDLDAVTIKVSQL